MTSTSEKILRGNFETPDKRQTYDKVALDLIALGETTLSRTIYEPGWRWSDSIWPLVRAEGCQIGHLFYMVSGRMAVRMKDGTEVEFGAGDVGRVPPGHDAWVVGADSVVLIDFGVDSSPKRRR
jgi:hypothetical protein